MPIKSKFRPVELTEVPLHQHVFSHFPKFGNKIALVDAVTGQAVSYKQLTDLQPRVSSSLVKLGVKKGDIVLMCSPNSLELPVVMYGILGAGATMSSMNPNYTTYEMAYQIRDCKPKVIYTMSHLADKIIEACNKCKIQPKIVTYGHKEGCIPYSQLISDDGKACPSTESLAIKPKEDVAFLLYSSGTTGLQKGVMLTHYNITSNALQNSHTEFRDPVLAAADPSDPAVQQIVMNYLPPYHVYGLVCLHVFAFVRGAKLVNLAKFDLKRFLEAIQKYKVTSLNLVPPVAILMAKHPLVSEYDLSSLKSVGGGAAPLSREIEKDVTKRLNVPPYRQGFGMTECSPTVFNHPYWSNRAGSVGMLMCNTEVQIVDPVSKKEMGPNERGELWVRGPQVMKGYLNKPKATREAIDLEGWLHTGDIVYYDDDGYFYIVDRIKELIKYKSYQVAPAELEALVLEHPSVTDAAVIGIPDSTAGELPRAYVVRKPGAALTEQNVHDFVKERATYYKWLRGGVVFVDEVPKSAAGKILRRKLRDDAIKSRL